MEKTKFAELNHDQLKEIKQLEERLDITLIAYDSSVLESQNEVGSNSDV